VKGISLESYQKKKRAVNDPFLTYPMREVWVYTSMLLVPKFFDKRILSIIMDKNLGLIFFKTHFYVLDRMIRIQF